MLWKALASTALLLTTLGHAALATTNVPGTTNVQGNTSTNVPGNTNVLANTNTCACPAPTSTNGTPGGTSSTPAGTSSSPAPSSSNGQSSNGPQFVIYSDKWITNALPDVSQVKGYTAFLLSFLLTTGPADQAQAWGQLDKGVRQQMKKKYNDAGIKILVSAFGGTEYPTSAGVDPTKIADTFAQWIIDNDLDGIDVDYEDFNAMNLSDGRAENWLITFTKAIRAKLPKGKYIVTHAPVAPWFSPLGYKSGAYRTVHKEVGDMIDWYNLQYYNQNDYNDCNTIFFKSSNKYPETSLSEIAGFGVPQNKLVVGKPGTNADASNGWMDPNMLATCLQQGKAKGWSGGVMVWQFPNADAKWIEAVRAKSWPVSS